MVALKEIILFVTNPLAIGCSWLSYATQVIVCFCSFQNSLSDFCGFECAKCKTTKSFEVKK
jgi:hypothetical protein